MEEQDVVIPIEGTKYKMQGVLRGDYSMPLVILAHGLSGWMHETLMFNASRYFEKKGFATLRINLIGDGEDEMNISEFGVYENAKEIDAATTYVKKQGAKWVAVIGHSYSGMAILYSKEQNFDAAVLWDPSHDDAYDTFEHRLNLERDFTFIKELDSYVSDLGSGYVISRKVFEDTKPGSSEKAKELKIPTLIVNASYSKQMQDYGKKYAKLIEAETKQIIIPNSSHPFVEDGAMEKLFSETAKWLKDQLKP